jgi:DNA-binding IclR family transcriptional regulator
VAAISVSGPVKRMNENRERVIEKLQSVGNRVSRRLGYIEAMKGRL